MIERTHTIVIGAEDSVPEQLRLLLDLADDPAEVAFVTGTRDVRVTQALAERFAARQAEPEPQADPELKDFTAEPVATPAPRKRAPRKAAAPAAEES